MTSRSSCALGPEPRGGRRAGASDDRYRRASIGRHVTPTVRRVDVASISNPSTLTLLTFTVLNSPTVHRRLAPNAHAGATWYLTPPPNVNPPPEISRSTSCGDPLSSSMTMSS